MRRRRIGGRATEPRSGGPGMTQAPPAPCEVPGPVSALLAGATITEYAYLTPGGEPLCWPVTPFWYPERNVLGVATGLAYPAKAHYARRRPRVAALFAGTGRRSTEVLLQGEAVVLDGDVQAGTDRYVREMRAKFLSARLALNPPSGRPSGFYPAPRS